MVELNTLRWNVVRGAERRALLRELQTLYLELLGLFQQGHIAYARFSECTSRELSLRSDDGDSLMTSTDECWIIPSIWIFERLF